VGLSVVIEPSEWQRMQAADISITSRAASSISANLLLRRLHIFN